MQPVDPSTPQRLCTDCCNNLEITHLLIVSCLRTDMRLKRLLNFAGQPGYENKYNTLVQECSLEMAQEIWSNDSMHLDSMLFSESKIVNSDTDVASKILKKKMCYGSQNECTTVSRTEDDNNCGNKQDNVKTKFSQMHDHFQSNVEPNKMSHEKSIRCGNCKEVYHDKREFSKHILKLHEGQLLYMCTMCEKTYEKWSSLDVHEATHKTDKLYLCDLCGKSFKHSNNLRGHKRIHLDESVKKRHVCAICGNSFRSRFHLREHMNQHDGFRPYSCDQCAKSFHKRIQLRQHKLTHGSNRHKCPICGVTFNRKGNMNAHIKRHNNEHGTYTCSVCSCKCKSMSELQIHRKNHSEEEIIDGIKKKYTDKELWRCSVCNKVFSKRANLTNHERLHKGDRLRVECNECGKKLASRSSLMYHKKSIHLKERSHMCHYCGDSFVSREARLIHERTHTGERPYVCTVCGKRYRCSSNLCQHTKIHTGLKLYKCHCCNKDFTRKGALSVHERIHTGVKPYSCVICDKRFAQKNDMLRHAKTHSAKSTQRDQSNQDSEQRDEAERGATHEQNASTISDYVNSPPHVLQTYITLTSSEI
ncbi:gastrula zinc finger protein XlCGF57.1-like isoform X2 [Pseudomyrmex gracilis]|uniref:gastrula zinc finger protein XlCGF57.1-like isoform X2 n=1 Tax=Pseudomyrmex gracilis TaxID=219809 RepID=UPI000995C9BD|nr:gastrula zinc finger protein XlCGF57.1-like isoform X2 [Pseudomyrmex gracilis]